MTYLIHDQKQNRLFASSMLVQSGYGAISFSSREGVPTSSMFQRGRLLIKNIVWTSYDAFAMQSFKSLHNGHLHNDNAPRSKKIAAQEFQLESRLRGFMDVVADVCPPLVCKGLFVAGFNKRI